ncbi:MAG TPA: hypothetical protein VMF06_02050 [Candidatus Limnocylindria bacterium]|jgi:hypothetical protein|nr:hypothetical protein [Candidatus Limnocylindria bacterium]
MGEAPNLETISTLEKAVIEEILRCEPHPALSAQWKEAKVRKREFYPHAVFTFFLVSNASGAPRGIKSHTLGGYTFARLKGRQALAAFTLHTDHHGKLSHLAAFMDDDSSWPSRLPDFEVFSVKRPNSGGLSPSTSPLVTAGPE